jgi:hypothetical protein
MKKPLKTLREYLGAKYSWQPYFEWCWWADCYKRAYDWSFKYWPNKQKRKVKKMKTRVAVKRIKQQEKRLERRGRHWKRNPMKR